MIHWFLSIDNKPRTTREIYSTNKQKVNSIKLQ